MTKPTIDDINATLDSLQGRMMADYQAQQSQFTELQRMVAAFIAPDTVPEDPSPPDEGGDSGTPDAPSDPPPPIKTGDEVQAFLADLQPGEWGQYGQTLSGFLPLRWRKEQGLFDGENGSKSIIEEWNSAFVYDGRIWHYGGGHQHGANTAFYCLDLSDMTWSRVGEELPYDSTVMVGGEAYPVPTGAPAPTHTYDGLAVAAGKVFLRGNYRMHFGALWGIGSETWVYDIADDRWREIRLMTGWHCSAYDPKRNILYDECGWYDPEAETVLGQYKLPHAGSTNIHYAQLRYDAGRDVLWYWHQYGDSQFDLYRVERDGQGGVIGTTLVNQEQKFDGKTGMDVGPDGRLYFWLDDLKLRIYDPEADAWEVLPAPKFDNGVNVNSGKKSYGAGNIFGKWNYIADLGVFIGLDGYQMQPVFYRPMPAPVGDTPDEPETPEDPEEPEAPTDPAPGGLYPKEVRSGVLYYNGINSGLLDYQLVSPWSNAPADDIGIPKSMGVAGEHYYLGVVTEYIAQHIAGNAALWQTVQAQADFDYPWSGGGGYTPSLAHLAHWYWYPYLVTGDTRYLDKLREQVDWGLHESAGDNMMDHTNTRGTAWGLVSLAELASVDPDYVDEMEATRQYLLTMSRKLPGLGYLDRMKEPSQNFGNPAIWEIPTWQSAFLLEALAHTVLLGFDAWRPLLESQLGFIRTLFDHNPDWTATYTDFVVWSRDQEVTPDNVWEVNSAPVINASSHMRAQYTRAGIAMAAVAGVAGAMDFCQEYGAWVEGYAWPERWDWTKNNVIVP